MILFSRWICSCNASSNCFNCCKTKRKLAQASSGAVNPLVNEENVLFPYVYEMFQAKEEGLKVAKFHCGTILYPIEVMEDEHNHEGNNTFSSFDK